jgi:hypothetical protein
LIYSLLFTPSRLTPLLQRANQKYFRQKQLQRKAFLNAFPRKAWQRANLNKFPENLNIGCQQLWVAIDRAEAKSA